MAENKKVKTKYYEDIQKELQKELGLDNIMSVPVISKIVVNAGVGKAANGDSSYVDEMVEDFKVITGQKPVVTVAKKAISNFKLREGMNVGVKVTLRKDRMWDFYDRLVNVVLPRVRDFRGVSVKAFDKNGNYALGIDDQTVFPEIDTSKMIKIKPLQVIICTTAETDEQAKLLLEKLGMPFKKPRKQQETK